MYVSHEQTIKWNLNKIQTMSVKYQTIGTYLCNIFCLKEKLNNIK